MNHKLTKLTIESLAGTILFNSCGAGYIYEESAEEINQSLHKQTDTRSTDYNSIAIPFSNNDIDYLSFLNELAQDIINNPDVATKFIDDPNVYIKSKGYTGCTIEPDSKLTKMILCLSDAEIGNAIKNQDINLYLDLMITKGYIKNITIEDSDNVLEIADKIHDLFYGKPKIPNKNLQYLNSSFAFFYLAVVVGVCAVVWAVVAEHVGAANAVVLATVVAQSLGVVTSGKPPLLENLYNSHYLEIWNIKSEDNSNINIVADQYIKRMVEDNITYLKKNYPEELSKYSKAEIVNAVLININNLSTND